MPLGPGGLDSNGIWLYGEDDSEALASDLLNLGMQSVSDAISGGLGAILQVVSTTKTDVFLTTSNSFVDVTGLSASITPSSTSSKIMIIATVNLASEAFNVNSAFLTLLRGSTSIADGDTAGSRIGVYTGTGSDTSAMTSHAVNFLDSPNTTSEVNYKFQIASNVSGKSILVNRWFTDTDSATRPRGVSTITLMEVAG